MEIVQIRVNAELLFELHSKNDWINRMPHGAPAKQWPGEEWIWLDAEGNTFQRGADFEAAKQKDTYPCKVYRTIPCSIAYSSLEQKTDQPITED